MDVLPPRWTEFSDTITDLLANIATKGQKLDKLHQKHVLPGFNDEEAKKVEEAQIERLTQEITKGFHDCHRCIQKIEQMVRDSQYAGTITRAEETMAKNIQTSLASRVQDASAGFRKKQSAYLKSRFFSTAARCVLTCIHRASWNGWLWRYEPGREIQHSPARLVP